MLPLGFIKRLVMARTTALLSAEHVVLCRVAVLCKRRIMLTGTPLQNDLQELQNLLGFLLPDIFHVESAAELSAGSGQAKLGMVSQMPFCNSWSADGWGLGYTW